MIMIFWAWPQVDVIGWILIFSVRRTLGARWCASTVVGIILLASSAVAKGQSCHIHTVDASKAWQAPYASWRPSFDEGVEFTLGFIQRSPDMFLGLRRVCKSLRTKMQLFDKTTCESSRIMAKQSRDSKMTSNTVYKYHVKLLQPMLSLPTHVFQIKTAWNKAKNKELCEFYSFCANIKCYHWRHLDLCWLRLDGYQVQQF